MAFTPTDMKARAEDLLLEGLGIEEIRAKLIEERKAQRKPAGTTPPTAILATKDQESQGPAGDMDIDILARSFGREGVSG